MSTKRTARNRGDCNHVILLGNNGKNAMISTLLNPDLGKHVKDESTSDEYLMTTAFNPRQCNFCKHVKVLDQKEEEVQCKKTDEKGDSNKKTVGPVGLLGKKVLYGKELDKSLGFIEGWGRSVIPRKPTKASQEWQDDGAWDSSPLRDPKPPPLIEYVRPAPSGTPDPRGVQYAKFLSIQYFIDIDILQNSLIDIDIFKIVRIDIDIDIFKTISIWISIFFKLSLSISILIFSNFPYQNPYVQTFLIDIM